MLLTIRQAAEKLAVSPKTIRRAIDSGRLKVRRLGQSAKSERIHPNDLEAFLDSCLYTREAGYGGPTSRSVVDALDGLLGPAIGLKQPSLKLVSGKNHLPQRGE